jgi:Cu/Ag efflux protein CusF
MKHRFSFTAFLFAAAFASTVFAQPAKQGTLRGTITGRDAASNTLTVAHEEVTGIMGSMTMSYAVRGSRVDSLPHDGAEITAILHQSGSSHWLTDVMPVEAKTVMKSGMPMPAESQHEQPATQHGNHAMPSEMPMPNMPGMKMTSDRTGDLLMRQASGTSMNPAAAPMHMEMMQHGDWMLMLHGAAFVSQVTESGPRGDNKLFSTNWLMGMADRSLGGGHVMLRTMLSLEPLTVGDKYPELFQTGETIHGRPIVDAQHPHDFFMELAAEYAHPLTENTIGYIYAAPFGDPSLGPVAYPHRASASEIPQAALGHHVQDSTHIAGSVLTIGAQSGMLGYAISGFHGREPDENRWNIDTGRIDSWATRITFDPSPNWTAQISTGHLEHPEAVEPGNVQRTTASVAYSQETALGHWDASLIFGHNRRSQGHSTSSWLVESVLQFAGHNYVTGRAEAVDKDELFADQTVSAAIAGTAFRVKALTVGYTRDLLQSGTISGAIGANATVYAIPGAIKPYYGDHPHSLYLFLRLRGQGAALHAPGKS